MNRSLHKRTKIGFAIKKPFEIFKYLFVTLASAVVIGTSALGSEKLQTKLANKLVNMVREQYGIEMELGGLKIEVPNKFTFTDIYIPDHHNDTLIFAKKLYLEYNGFNTDENSLVLSNVKLDNGKLHLQKKNRDEVYNFMTFVKKFSSDKKAKKPFKLRANTLKINNLSFEKVPHGCPECTEIIWRKGELDLSNFKLDGQHVSARVNQISYKDNNRFDLHFFKGDAAYQEGFMEVKNLHFKTDQSQVVGNARLDFNSIKDFSDFVNQVDMSGNLNPSVVSSEEIYQWIPQYPRLKKVKIQGKFQGPVNNLRLENLNLIVDDKTVLKGKVALQKTTKPDSLTIDAEISSLATNFDHVNWIWTTMFKKGIPFMSGKVTDIKFVGNYKGTLNDLNVNGTLNTNLGEIRMKTVFNNFRSPENVTYSGWVDFKSFDLGKFTQNPKIGKLSMVGEVSGISFKPKTAKTTLNVDISKIGYNGYVYQNITLNGDAEKGRFKGKMKSNDPNAKIDFKGELNINPNKGKFDFYANVSKLDLYKTHFVKDTIAVLSTIMDVDFRGQDLDNFEGEIVMKEATYETKNKFYFFNQIKIDNRFEKGFRRSRINSELLTGEISGRYSLTNIKDHFIAHVSDNFINPKAEKKNKNGKKPDPFAFTANFTLNNTNLLAEIFAPELFVEQQTQIYLDFNKEKEAFQGYLSSREIKYRDFALRDLGVNFSGQGNKGGYSINAGFLHYNNQLEGDTISVEGQFEGDSINYRLFGVIIDSVNSEVISSGNFKRRDKMLHLSVDSTTFNVGYDEYFLPNGNVVKWNKDSIIVTKFDLYDQSTDGFIKTKGKWAEKSSKPLEIDFYQFEIALLNYLIRREDVNFSSGKINGEISARNAGKIKEVNTNLTIDSLTFNDSYLGEVTFYSFWDDLVGGTKVDIYNSVEEKRYFEVNGELYGSRGYLLDLNYNINEFDISPIGPFLSAVFGQFSGKATGEGKIKGTVFEPEFKGDLVLSGVTITVDYLNTTYKLDESQKFAMSDQEFAFDNLSFTDIKYNTKGSINGKIKHDFFQDFEMDLTIKANNLLALDSEAGSNPYFYGTVFSTGEAKIFGPVEELTIQVNGKSEDNTVFKIPISNPTEVEDKGFITFVKEYSEEDILAQLDLAKIKESGIEIEMNIQVTELADILLVMDEVTGDVISGSGNGDLRIKMNRQGELEMYGSIELVKGKYLFMLSDFGVVNKRFSILPGGEITWTGDPYGARVDLTAVYRQRASLDAIVADLENPGRKYDVDLSVYFTGEIMNPNINFNIQVPNTSPAIQEGLSNVLSDQNKMNYQAFSLLVFNAFAPENDPTQDYLAEGVYSNVNQLMWSQLSNVLSRGMGGNFDLLVSYDAGGTPNDQGTASGEQIEVGFSTTLNDKWTIITNFDVPVGSNTNQLVGDQEVQYRINRNVRVRAFNRSNQDNPALDLQAPYTQGLGIFYRTDFDTGKEFLHNILNIHDDRID